MNRKEEFLEVTMKIVAKKGLNGFSIKQVTRAMNVSEALIYKYYPTKSNLFFSCFVSVHKRIAAIFDNMTFSDNISDGSDESFYDLVYELWIKYFTFLVSNSFRTIFYFDYRDSAYMRDENFSKENDIAKTTYFQSFANIVGFIDSRFHCLQNVPEDHLWTFILDATGMFAKKIIRGELPNTPESYQTVWFLISKGIMGILNG